MLSFKRKTIYENHTIIDNGPYPNVYMSDAYQLKTNFCCNDPILLINVISRLDKCSRKFGAQ